MNRYKYKNYGEYMRTQIATTQKKKRKSWVRLDNVKIISKYIAEQITPIRGICHGVRRGRELTFFKKYFPKCSLVGTDVMVLPKREKKVSVIKWDMHDVKRAWFGLFDFVYSNSWDHAYDPEYMFRNWGLMTRRGGFLIIEHSVAYRESNHTDPFGMDKDELKEFVSNCLPDFTGPVELALTNIDKEQVALIWRKT